MSTLVSYTLSLPPAPVSDFSDVDAPHDIFDPLGNGLVFPFERRGTDFDVKSGSDLVRACLMQLLRMRAGVDTIPGELPWDPSIGSKLHLMLHTNFTPATKELARVYIQQAVQIFEPRTELLDVSVRAVDQDGGRAVYLRILYATRMDDDGVGNVTVPEELLMEI